MHRHTDPETSRAAAATVPRLTHRQLVARIMAIAGRPWTAEQLEQALVGRCSPSSVRRCVKELAGEGRIVEIGERPNRSGCKARLWRWGG